MPEGGVLRLRTEAVERPPGAPEPGSAGGADGPGVALVVQDTGRGMDAATRARLFEPGFSTRTAASGGLGLAVVADAVRRSGATLACESAPGSGTTFRVTFPLAEPIGGAQPLGGAQPIGGAQPAAATPPAQADERAPGETVLVVDPERAVRTLCRRVLAGQGHRVLDAPDAGAALEQAAAASPPVALLLVDRRAPGADAPSFDDRLRLLSPGLAILELLPGSTAEGPSSLGKPFAATALLASARDALEAARASSLARRPAPAHAGPGATDAGARPRVLVVDDDAAVLRTVPELLASEYAVALAASGAEALDLLARKPCDVVLLDLFMPEMDGIEAAREIRARHPDTRIVAMSGAAGAASYLRAAERLGAVSSLRKPFSRQELLAAVQGALAASTR
jgi:CheY-like chemotaxis protein